MLSHRYPKRLMVLVTRNNFITVTETLSDTYTHTHTCVTCFRFGLGYLVMDV